MDMKRVCAVVIFSLLVASLPAQVVYAGRSDSLSEVVMDGLYGGLAGAIVGAATLAFVDRASEHEDNIKVGAGAGVILGTVYGTAKLSRALAEVKDGTMTVQLPAIQLTTDASVERGATSFNLNLFQLSF